MNCPNNKQANGSCLNYFERNEKSLERALQVSITVAQLINEDV